MTSANRPRLGVGLIGYAFMGAAHSQAWRTAPHFFDLPLRPRADRAGRPQSDAVTDAADTAGLVEHRDRLAPGARARRRRPGRRLHPR